jgi:hypothetical protein
VACFSPLSTGDSSRVEVEVEVGRKGQIYLKGGQMEIRLLYAVRGDRCIRKEGTNLLKEGGGGWGGEYVVSGG